MDIQVIAERRGTIIWVGRHYGRKLKETKNRHILTLEEIEKWEMLRASRWDIITELSDFEVSFLKKEIV